MFNILLHIALFFMKQGMKAPFPSRSEYTELLYEAGDESHAYKGRNLRSPHDPTSAPERQTNPPCIRPIGTVICSKLLAADIIIFPSSWNRSVLLHVALADSGRRASERRFISAAEVRTWIGET
jgi:hypothetical protein